MVSRITKDKMLRLTLPKNGTKNLFYVSSESGRSDEHIVVKHGGLLFCDCRDFMIRRLPVIGTSKFKTCKHGEFVAFVTRTIPEGTNNVFAFRESIVTQNDRAIVETTIIHEAARPGARPVDAGVRHKRQPVGVRCAR